MQLQFDTTPKYEICFSAVAFAQHTLPPSSWDLHVEVLRALRSIGKPAGQLSGGQNYTLDNADGALQPTVDLSRAAVEHLLGCIEQPMWVAAALENVVDTRAWLKDQLEGKSPALKIEA